MEMTSKEAAAYLSGPVGYTLSTKFVRDLKYVGKGPVVEKRDGRLVYRKSALDAFLSENGTDPEAWMAGMWRDVADRLRGIATTGERARPVTDADRLGPGMVVSAESWRPGGQMHTDGGLPFAGRSASLRPARTFSGWSSTWPGKWLSPNAEPNEDMWARSEESRDAIVGLYQRVWAHADATISLLPLDASGCVPWWREASNPVSLARILVHVTAETHRHVGHADIVRELADGSVGHRDGNDNMTAGNPAWWHEYRDHL